MRYASCGPPRDIHRDMCRPGAKKYLCGADCRPLRPLVTSPKPDSRLLTGQHGAVHSSPYVVRFMIRSYSIHAFTHDAECQVQRPHCGLEPATLCWSCHSGTEEAYRRPSRSPLHSATRSVKWPAEKADDAARGPAASEHESGHVLDPHQALLEQSTGVDETRYSATNLGPGKV